MKLKSGVFLILFSLLLVLGLQDVSSSDFVTELVDANLTEYNSTTPTINIKVVGDCTHYWVNVSFNYTDSTFDGNEEADVIQYHPTVVANDTSTGIPITTALAERTTIYLNITAWNETNINSTGENVPAILIDGRPTLTISPEDKIPIKGHSITFTATVTDGDSDGLGNDNTKIVICNSEGFTVAGGCTGTQYCTSSSFVDAGTPQTCSYTIPYTMAGGAHKIYAYAYDDNFLESTTAYTTYFTTASGVIEEVEEEEEGVGEGIGDTFKKKGALGVATETKIIGIPLWVIITFIVVILIAVYIKVKEK